MAKRQRLVVCLDGTWNKRDDSTNVLHHFGLALEGERATAAETVTQVKYYDEGVGTGVIDGVTGGAFGFGLEENVREAYDWLVASITIEMSRWTRARSGIQRWSMRFTSSASAAERTPRGRSSALFPTVD